MNMVRKHWQDFGLLLGVGVSLYVLLNWGMIWELRGIVGFSFVSILIHQFEEYRWPGTFGGLFNIAIFKSARPDHYPLNPHSAMIINLLIAYIFYLLPVLFPTVIWLGLAPVFMGFFQIVWHGVFANLKIRSFYNPGLFTAIFSIYRSGFGISHTSLLTILYPCRTGSRELYISSSQSIYLLFKGISG